mmetsp:Transcript_13739/g.19041  ORF Transcript_13739/g.19041 Transcript_13739/m.19041 type:complete len:163 (+) Transcript_13739:64-552(+)|eukprot:CAMPEP_0185264064 /NCGR_PEP_ID=MMETSP1359-20130426/17716_1 /TAXON_ID=552665 /ORGANISM="Bigelowiella longifila, Strain CCMP242" /LENGTH=162 /DNA_ID=CAMNT_0027852081 /DNA_START=40 /DNA_END=528 /DNA_ORIENTATION=-
MLLTAILLLMQCEVSISLQNTKQHQIHQQDLEELVPALGNISMVHDNQIPHDAATGTVQQLHKDHEISTLPETQNLVLIGSSSNQEASSRFMSLRVLKTKGNYLVAVCASLVVLLLGGLYFGTMFCRQGATDSGRTQFESSFPPNDTTTHPLIGGKEESNEI